MPFVLLSSTFPFYFFFLSNLFLFLLQQHLSTATCHSTPIPSGPSPHLTPASPVPVCAILVCPPPFSLFFSILTFFFLSCTPPQHLTPVPAMPHTYIACVDQMTYHAVAIPCPFCAASIHAVHCACDIFADMSLLSCCHPTVPLPAVALIGLLLWHNHFLFITFFFITFYYFLFLLLSFYYYFLFIITFIIITFFF